MKLADATALSAVGTDHQQVFINRAGFAVAHAARTMLGGSYGKRVLLIAGKGHNGDDGRVAAYWLTQWGAAVETIDADSAGNRFVDSRVADLVIDAAYGIGFHGEWIPPIVFDVPVLAVDMPSGLNALDGSVSSGVLAADRTVTFAAPKVGMFFGSGPALCGVIDVIDVGIDTSNDVDTYLVEATDVAAWVPPREHDAHKWDYAVRVIAGSDGMEGAASLVGMSALRAGSGMVHMSWRAGSSTFAQPTEIVGHVLPSTDWASFVAADIARFGAMVIGPGLGRGDDVGAEVRAILARCDIGVVIDGDGISGSIDPHGDHSTLRSRTAETILTPHDGEFASLGGDAMSADRIGATRDLASRIGCTVVRKGATTIISDAEGAVYLVASGDQRLATAGTGDVLSGIIGAFLARGLAAPEAAAAAAYIHGVAGSRCAAEGTIARDVVGLISDVLSDVMSHVN
jgi:ADP-dependent NAD(P)H-hydrate dehydratase / NAD(P)H-hydrate epimerase